MRKITLFILGVAVLNLVIIFAPEPTGKVPEEEDRTETEQRISPPETIRLLFAGDLMAHSVNFRMQNFNDIYSGVSGIIEEADLACINLESPVRNDKAYASYPRFSIQNSYLEAAIQGGFDLFSLANNHSCDYEKAGILSSIQSMEELSQTHRIYWSGLKKHPRSPFSPREIHIGEWKIGFLSITSFTNVWRDRDYVNICDYQRSQELEEDFYSYIRGISGLYDLLILAVHDGLEYRHRPLKRKERFFRGLAEAGADVVWGHHSHVLQHWEKYTTEAGNQALILYSMGNFISGQSWNTDPEDSENARNATGDSGIVQSRFIKRGDEIQLDEVQAILAFQYRDPKKGVIVRSGDSLERDPNLSESWRSFYKDRIKRLAWFRDGDQSPIED